ncbi:hypothetical protein D9V41_02890 [Aeromicrobium phragmitis]|uniref:Uncharacterized protein n=1 Tax=Aeromicrobium phragmitis TaxID=2478914 RepID=A0A3L8PMV7_9ACTN|nr:hypothetical protein [Aeromicrobium phragmitis]RLV56746.1 hypothetical protein D9V41_02890 [Aeromicrobium phragmitis]
MDALVGLIDHLSHLLERVETEVIPMLANLQTIAPDIHDMLDLIQELVDMLGKLPGMGRIKRRADEQQAELEKRPRPSTLGCSRSSGAGPLRQRVTPRTHSTHQLARRRPSA